MMPVLAALAVVAHQGSVLLVRRRNPPDAGLWGFPGGKVAPGETAREAAARECLEETGARVIPLKYLDNIDVIRRDEAGALAHHFLLAAVLCRYVEGTPVAADDVSDARFVTLEAIAAQTLPMSEDVSRLARLAVTSAP